MRKYQKEQAENFIQLLGEAHEEIRTNIEKKNYEPVLVTLADCQDGAIALGNLIEAAEGEACVTISLLEKYCELVFQIHTDISGGGYVDAIKTDKSLRKALTQIENSVRNDIKVRKEIAFFPYNASMWDSLESVYLAAKEDSDCDAYCVPIPYFEKRADGKLGQVHYEGAEYPKNIEITDWQTYNLEERRPDVMYIHNPYDASNRVTCVHPRFFSSNLKKYTDELVYIPYFVGPEIDPKDQAAIERMKHFCFLPGVIHADKVILQSENHRQVYIAEYSKAARQFGLEAKHTDRKYLEEKFLVGGSPKFDKVLRTKKEDVAIPDEWLHIIEKPDGSYKKIIFYNTSIQALLIHKEQMLKKMKHVLQTFKENKDEVALLWRPHPLLESTIKSMLPNLWEEYDALTKQYREEGWGIWDDTTDMNRAVVLSDAYYGDSSSVLQVYQKTGKPIMVQNVLNSGKSEEQCVFWSYNAVFYGNRMLLFSIITNLIIIFNLENAAIEKTLEFTGEASVSDLYYSMAELDNEIVCVPFDADKIRIIEKDTWKQYALEGILDSEEEKVKGKFISTICSDDMIWLIGENIRKVIGIHKESRKVIHVINLDEIEADFPIYFGKNSLIRNNYLYIPSRNSNRVLIINEKTGSHSWVELGKHIEGFAEIYRENDNIVLLDNKGIEYFLNKQCMNEGTRELPEELRGTCIWNRVNFDDKLVYLPAWDEKILIYKNNMMNSIEIGERRNQTGKVMFLFVHQYSDKLYFQLRFSGEIYCMNLTDETLNKVEIDFEDDYIRDIQSVILNDIVGNSKEYLENEFIALDCLIRNISIEGYRKNNNS